MGLSHSLSIKNELKEPITLNLYPAFDTGENYDPEEPKQLTVTIQPGETMERPAWKNCIFYYSEFIRKMDFYNDVIYCCKRKIQVGKMHSYNWHDTGIYGCDVLQAITKL